MTTTDRKEGDAADAQLDSDFRAALAHALEGTELTACWLDERYRGRQMPWLAVRGHEQAGGYWIGFGLEHWSDVPPGQWRTYLFAQFRAEDCEDPDSEARPLDVYLSGPSARDPELLASMTVFAVLTHIGSWLELEETP